MAMSGIGVDNEVMLKYDEVKKATSSLAFAIFAIKNEKQVVLEKSVRNDEVPALLEEAVKEGLKQLPKESDNYALLRSILMKSPPRYAAIKIFFKADTSTDKVALISWCSDSANVKQRMLHSSTKDALLKKLDGVVPYHASDDSDLDYKAAVTSVSKGKAVWE